MKHSCHFRQARVLMDTFAPEGLVFLTATPAGLADIETILLITVERRVFRVLPDITAAAWGLPRL